MNCHGTEGLESGNNNIKLDPNVIAELPTSCRIISTESHGVSFWANIGRIEIELEDGTPQSIFIKVISNDTGKNMMQSEFECTRAIHALMPSFVPKPIAWGTYQTRPDIHFFLCEFREMLSEMPDPNVFTARLAALHQKSESPEGKFGFHMTTYNGNLPQLGGWEGSWEMYFTKSLRLALDLEVKAKGSDPEFDVLIPKLFEKVIPRLLRPLESEGRSVKPCLVHGDLWYANSGLDVNTGEPLIFDACSFYAHNEYEFGQWRPICNRFGAEYLAAYHSFMKISPPEEDYDGRLDLYKLRFNTHVSALFTGNLTLREQMLGDMKDLVERYG
ncbi:MAG: hypothetical protein Q9181_001126 [Wetmoreana brouardii]